MDDNTNWTPSPDDNRLGLTDKNQINKYEAKGVAAAELFVFQLESDVEISVQLISEIHRIAFSELYDWAGQWRTVQVTVGQLIPAEPVHVLQRMYQFVDNLNVKIGRAIDRKDHLDCMLYAHYEFIRIHPYNNGNGRTGRMLMNLVAMKLGYEPMELHHREGSSRRVYIDAMQAADGGNFDPLTRLINKELIAF